MQRIIRTPAARAAEIERFCTHTSTDRRFWAESARLEDATNLRKRLLEKHHIGVIDYDARGNEVLDFKAWDRRHAMQKRVERVVQWAKARMKLADERFAARSDERLAA